MPSHSQGRDGTLIISYGEAQTANALMSTLIDVSFATITYQNEPLAPDAPMLAMLLKKPPPIGFVPDGH